VFKIIHAEFIAPGIKRFVIEAPRIARKQRPGQFVIIRVCENGERIPLTIERSDTEKGTVNLVVQSIGKTTNLLNSLDKNLSQSVLQGLEQHNPRLGEQIRQQLLGKPTTLYLAALVSAAMCLICSARLSAYGLVIGLPSDVSARRSQIRDRRAHACQTRGFSTISKVSTKGDKLSKAGDAMSTVGSALSHFKKP